uniref:pentatricopeptide repeat-containing protein At3g61520, mitochondrial n=1 Tax=Fragaria vesca subsp. vesca TaxID=101020 RepID=UPI0005CB0B5B|nr:PREDICTED: pentatricopeptide repeat-containing protein At3g61520, mitochondrial [Fragaria vesca subsp. vesca]
MKILSLSASKPLLHRLKPQTPKSKPPVFLLTHHLCTNPTSNPNPPPQNDDVSLATQFLQLLQPNEKDWNFDQLQTLLFSNSTSPSPHSLSSALQAVLELTLRERISEKKLFELYQMAKERNVELNVNTAALLIRSLERDGMEEEGLVVFKELDSELKSTHIRNVVIKMLVNMGRVDDALKVLDEMLDPEAQFRVDEITADIVIGSLLGKEKKGRGVGEEEIVGLVSKFGKHGVFPDSRILTKLVTVLCRNGKVSRAWDVLCDVMKMGGGLEAASCNAVLTALGRSNDFKRMGEVMVKMEEIGIKPNLITFGLFVNHLCKSRRIDAALGVFEKMSVGVEGVSAKPDVIIIYNTLIDGLCKVGRPQEGLSLMEKMRSQDGCAPNTVTYSCLIGGFNKVGDIDRGLELFEKMKEEGIPLNVVTLNTLLDGLCRHGRLNAALEFFKEMQRDGLKGNAVSYTLLISSFCDVNNISKAMELFNQMLSAECPTDVRVYHCLISCLSLAGRMEDASFVVSKLKEAGFSMDTVSYNVMIKGFSGKNMPDKIHEMIEEMEASRVKPDSVTYNTLLAYLSKARDFKGAHKVLDRMMDEGIVPTVVTYGTLIHAHCLDGNIDKAMRIFRDMGSKSKISPNTVIYNELINSFCKNNDVEQALSLVDDMKDKGARPNTQTFNALFKGLRENNLLEKAFQFMDRMVEQACKPDYTTMEILTEWLSCVGEIERLRKFVQGYPVSTAGFKVTKGKGQSLGANKRQHHCVPTEGKAAVPAEGNTNVI